MSASNKVRTTLIPFRIGEREGTFMINHQHTELEQEEEVVLDPESDDSEASDILELIERESSKGVEPEVITEQPAVAEKAPAEDFALESLYFRSFGERPLLK